MQNELLSLKNQLEAERVKHESLIVHLGTMEARYQQEISQLKNQFGLQTSRNEESEREMAEHILQSDKEMDCLRSLNDALVSTCLSK
jgi:hypothetical protein